MSGSGPSGGLPDGADAGIDGGRRSVSFRAALGWSYVMNGGQYLITTVITLLLAAILGPTAFGTVAMATVYVLFVQMLLQQGMNPALVQRPVLQPRHLDTAFWMVLGTSVVLTVLSVALAGWWAEVNRTPELAAVIRALSALIPLQGLILVQDALLRRRMNFRSLALRSNVAAVAGGAVGLTLALTGFGVWALVAQHLVRAVVELAVLWMLSDWRPKARFSPDAARQLLSYSVGASVASFGLFVNNRADALLIGLFFGPTAVGLYRFAARFVDIVIDVTVRSLQTVSLPELSRLQGDSDRFAGRTIGVVRTSALLAVPALGVLAGASQGVMALVGDEWSAAAYPLQLLCVVGAIRAVTLFNGPMLQALRRMRLLAGVTWLSALLSAGGFVLAGVLLGGAAIDQQVLGMAASRMLLFGVVLFGINLWLLRRVAGLHAGAMWRATMPSVAAGVAGYGAAAVLDRLVGAALVDEVRLLLVGGTSLALAVALLLLLDRSLRDLLRALLSRARRRRSAGAGAVPGRDVDAGQARADAGGPPPSAG